MMCSVAVQHERKRRRGGDDIDEVGSDTWLADLEERKYVVERSH